MSDEQIKIKLEADWWIPRKERDEHRKGFHPVLSQIPELKQIIQALGYLPETRRAVCVQAGGRLGLWPIELARHFAEVHTFEPDPTNFACLEANVVLHKPDAEIVATCCALGVGHGDAFLKESQRSDGMHYLAPAGETWERGRMVPMSSIDELALEACDALFLDVEGLELDVLRGAIKTLRAFKPLIVAEENILIERYGRKQGDVQRWLEELGLGYRLVAEHFMYPPNIQHDGRFHGSDLIFAVVSNG